MLSKSDFYGMKYFSMFKYLIMFVSNLWILCFEVACSNSDYQASCYCSNLYKLMGRFLSQSSTSQEGGGVDV